MLSKQIRQSQGTFNNTAINMPTISMSDFTKLGLTIVLTGATIQGTVKLQECSDGASWKDVTATGASSQVIAGPASFQFNYVNVCQNQVRVVITSTDTHPITSTEVWGTAKVH